MLQKATPWIGAGLLLGLVACNSSSDTPDTSAPLVTSATQNRTVDPTGHSVDVQFNEPVSLATSETTGNYAFSGGLIVVSATRQSGGHIVRVVLDAPAVPGDFTLDVSGVEDAAGNVMVAVVGHAIVGDDTTAPSASAIESLTVSGTDNDTITVTFDDAMIESEVENPANWSVESPLGSIFDVTGATIVYDALARTATMTLDAGGQNLTTGEDVHATFATMRDVAGNTIEATTIGVDAVTATIVGDDLAPEIVAAWADGVANTVTFRFSEPCTFLETADLVQNTPVFGTRFELTDADGIPAVAAGGTIAITGNVGEADGVTISDGTTAATFEFDYGGFGTVELTGDPVDGDRVTISDGVTAVTFEYDTGGGVSAGNVQVFIFGGAPDITTDELINAVNANGFGVTAYHGAFAEAILINDGIGTAGNVLITEVDAFGVITTTGMAGGGTLAGNVPVAAAYLDTDGTAQALFTAINNHVFGVTATAGLTISDFVLTNDATGTAGNVAITETDTNGTIDFTGMAGGAAAAPAPVSPTAASSTDAGLGTVVTYGNVPAPGDTVEIYGVVDLAGNPMFAVAAETILAQDANQPSLALGNSSLTAVTGEENDLLYVEFDRPMSPWGLLDPANYVFDPGTPLDLSDATFSFNGTNAVTIFLFGSGAPSVQFADAHDLSINNLETAQGVLRTIADVEIGVAPGGDNVPPSVGVNDARLDPLNADSILVIYSEAIDETAAETAASYTNAGNVATTATLIGPRVVRATFGVDPQIGDALTIATTAATDLAGNSAAAILNLTVAAADAIEPTVTGAAGTAVADDGGDFVQVSFSEQVDLATALDPANYVVTNGDPISLTGATLQYRSGTPVVNLYLADGVHLDPVNALSVTVSNVTDVAGNAITPAATGGAVGGDTTAPDFSAAFVNYRVDATGATVDVLFDEDVDETFATTTGNWTPSGGQIVTSVTALGGAYYRVVLDAALGTADTLSLTGLPDLAGNASGAILEDPLD